ncbi:uncharacterized protein BKCO1_19000186 [Diplodia corticola]|uniref:2EXR domain-containing protein n=1 Tax=Diplodia corticola TaxID=236234 RepID=A0A1J9S695_9PEZI|nr:uncharacterized protein BKCO1_19000186 [Diplodia corticola]OJD35133.1 hypothetical protein BKCO1_19000186 [Diplodia corticola]
MAHTSFKSRVDSFAETHGEPPTSKSGGTSTNRCSILRSAPIDPQYSFDLFHEIQRAWSTELTCSPDLMNANSSPPSPCNPAAHQPLPPHTPSSNPLAQPLSHHLSSPDSLYHSLTSHPVSPQPHSPLFSHLPPELRTQIFSHLLTYPGVILCVTSGGLPPHPPYNLHPSLLRTCRLAALEALPLLYGGRNRFSVPHIPNLLRSRAAPPCFALWPRTFALVRRLNVDVPDKFIDRFYRAPGWSAAPDGFERYTEIVAAVVALAARAGRLVHLQVSLVRNCALESYTSWGPYLARDAPLMRAVERDFLPGVLGDGGGGGGGGRRARFLLVVPCGAGSEAGAGAETQRAFDVLRPDGPAVVHAVARSLGALQKTARLNGLRLEDSLRVVVRDGDGGGEGSRTEILVDEECPLGSGEERQITLEVSC